MLETIFFSRRERGKVMETWDPSYLSSWTPVFGALGHFAWNCHRATSLDYSGLRSTGEEVLAQAHL